MTSLGNILDRNSAIKDWPTIQDEFNLPNYQAAYHKLSSNLDINKVSMKRSMERRKIYVHTDRLAQGVTIWQFQIGKSCLSDTYRMGDILMEPT